MFEFERAPQDSPGSFFGSESEENKFQPYRKDLQSYLSSHHNRLIPFADPSTTSLEIVEAVEESAAEFLNSSDISARYVSSPEFQSISQRQKKELRGICSIGIFICIDGRLVPVLVGSPVFDISETKAGLVPVTRSPLDGELELANPRIIESIGDRPLKESSEILQFSTGHEDSDKPDSITCAAVELMIGNGSLPNDGSYRDAFRQMLANTGVAVGATFNRSALARGYSPLKNAGLTAMYDTRTAGFTVDGVKTLSSTQLTKAILKSDDLETIQRLGQPGLFRNNFTDPATLISREYAMYNIEKILLRQSKTFREYIESFIDQNMAGYTENQKQAFRFFEARAVASQYSTGLYQGGDQPVSAHNEQYISSSTNGLRVGQNDPRIQSFGANVANYEDSVSHLETKVALADKIGKMRSPYIAFLSESVPEKSTSSSDRNARAKLRSHMMAVMESPTLLQRIKAGQLWLVPAILQEKTGITKSIPNLAI